MVVERSNVTDILPAKLPASRSNRFPLAVPTTTRSSGNHAWHRYLQQQWSRRCWKRACVKHRTYGYQKNRGEKMRTILVYVWNDKKKNIFLLWVQNYRRQIKKKNRFRIVHLKIDLRTSLPHSQEPRSAADGILLAVEREERDCLIWFDFYFGC